MMSTRRSIVCAALATICLGEHGLLTLAQIKSDPERELWAALKKALKADNGDEYFKTNVKNTQLGPLLKGVVIAVLPNGEGSKLMLAMSDNKTPEITLIIPRGNATPKLKPGTEIEFIADALDFTKAPFMLTVELFKLVGFSVPAQ